MDAFLYSENAYAKCELIKETDNLPTYPVGSEVILHVEESDSVPILGGGEHKNSQEVGNAGDKIHTVTVYKVKIINNWQGASFKYWTTTEAHKQDLKSMFKFLGIVNINNYKNNRRAQPQGGNYTRILRL